MLGGHPLPVSTASKIVHLASDSRSAIHTKTYLKGVRVARAVPVYFLGSARSPKLASAGPNANAYLNPLTDRNGRRHDCVRDARRRSPDRRGDPDFRCGSPRAKLSSSSDTSGSHERQLWAPPPSS